MRLEGKSALVTGAGSGIGRAIAEHFVREGAGVAIVDQNVGGAQETADRILQDSRADILVLQSDVSRSEDVQEAMQAVVDRWGGLDVLVNDAGIFWAHRGDTIVTEMDEEVWDHVITVNLKSVFLCCKYGIPLMANGGSIINIASIGGLLGRDTAQAYVAAKGGMIALTRTIAVQYAPRRIRANAILPGRVDTPLVADDYATPSEREAFARSHPLGRFGTPDDIAPLAVYLASDESSWVTAASYVVDGGYMAV
jgi:NAD(P)-dependent dehydrogenase (short-subunit alcohol dehydrogenase family)